jgi:hypothetical protein
MDASFGSLSKGHASSDVGDAYGTEGYPFRVLAEAIGRLLTLWSM